MTAIQPHEMSRELKLKLALAALLTDDIEVTDLCNCVWRRGEYAGLPLRETEWEHAALLASQTRHVCLMNSWRSEAERILRALGVKWDKP